MEHLTITLEDKKIVLSYDSFDTDINMDQITQIDYSNIFGDMVTVPTLLNKIGLLKADVAANVKDHDMELSILKSERMEYYRKELVKTVPYVRGTGDKIIEPGSTEVENAVFLDPAWKIMRKTNIRMHRDLEYIESLYWSVKLKGDTLSGMMKNVVPLEFQNGILEGTVNTMMIKSYKNVLPGLTPKTK